MGTEWTGQISVFAFYTLSGYLMTRVLNERYGFTTRGIVAFLVNRVLRLWPAYLVIMLLAFVALCFLPLGNFSPFIRMPRSAVDIITNVTILGQVTFDYLQWLPLAKPLVTSWSLSIEIFSYLLLALYFARSSARLCAFATLGVFMMAISTAWCAIGADPAAYGPYCLLNRYAVVQAGCVPFAFGGLYYFHRNPITEWIVKYRGLSVCALGVALATTSRHGRQHWACWRSGDRGPDDRDVSESTADSHGSALHRNPPDLDATVERAIRSRHGRSRFFWTCIVSPFHFAHADCRSPSDRSAYSGAKHWTLSDNDGGCTRPQYLPGAHGTTH